jgi:hypothetical protein
LTETKDTTKNGGELWCFTETKDTT